MRPLGARIRVLALLSLTSCADETGSKTAADPSQHEAASERADRSLPPVAAGCAQHRTNAGVIFECDGYIASRETHPDAPSDLEGDLDALMQALASTMTPISEELGAKIVKEKIDIELDGKAWRGARVLAVRPDTEGAYYATCHVALREKVMLSCCASTADGISKCQPMLEFLAVFGER